MNAVLAYALQILGAQAQEAIERAPRKYRRDIENVEAFIKAVPEAAKTRTVEEAEMMAKDLEPIFRELVDGLVSLGKPSLGWIFGGFDPFKSMRFEADKYARRWSLDWSR